MAHLDLQRGTFSAADTLLGSRDSRRIGHNTTLHRSGPDIAVRYHSTDIVTLSDDGWLTVDTNGWHTVTTWQRINAIIPGPWRVASDRGTPWVWYSGRKITPYVDGLAIHADNVAVGMNGATLLTADDIAAIIDAADTDAAARAEKRAARLLREHPTVGAPRTHARNLYAQRARDCARCDAELSAEREARTAAAHAEHAAMAATLARNPDDAAPWTDAEYAAAGSRIHREYGRDAVRSVSCPWDCPDRPRHW